MAQAQVIRGTAEELIAYLEKRPSLSELTLIVPQEPAGKTDHLSYPEGAVFRNGVPLFPTEGRTEPVTMEHVKQLLEEE